MFERLKDRANTWLLSLCIAWGINPLTALADGQPSVGSNLNQKTSSMFTRGGVEEVQTILRYISMILIVLGISLTAIAMAMNAYNQSKAIQRGDSSTSQAEWKQLATLIKNVALVTFLLLIVTVLADVILGVTYGDLIKGANS